MYSQEPKTIKIWNKATCSLLSRYDYITQKFPALDFKVIKHSENWFRKLESRFKEKDIDHPYFHKCLREFFKIWFSRNIKSFNGHNQKLYSSLGKINLYSFHHAVCCGLIPQDFRQRNMSIIDLINKKSLSKNKKWTSYDYLRRQHYAKFTASWLKNNLDKFYNGTPCIIIDYAGGNGEWAIHLSRILKKTSFSHKVHIVVKELNIGMIHEGQKKVKELAIKNITFIKSSVEVPFKNIRKYLPKHLKHSPIIASVSSYTMGAFPDIVLPKAIDEMKNSLIKGGLFLIWDFADQRDDLYSFLKYTKLKGITYQLTRFICKKPLSLCYSNWNHNINHISSVGKLLKSQNTNFSDDWFISTCTTIPLLFLWKYIITINVPGFIERTFSYTK